MTYIIHDNTLSGPGLVSGVIRYWVDVEPKKVSYRGEDDVIELVSAGARLYVLDDRRGSWKILETVLTKPNDFVAHKYVYEKVGENPAVIKINPQYLPGLDLTVANSVHITSTSAAALEVEGGVRVGSDIDVGGDLYVGGDMGVANNRKLYLEDANGNKIYFTVSPSGLLSLVGVNAAAESAPILSVQQGQGQQIVSFATIPKIPPTIPASPAPEDNVASVAFVESRLFKVSIGQPAVLEDGHVWIEEL